ncbi:hypothetical protein [Cysteiniphilum marinum]|uniref:hypothetical protein n=1 Tax=Cysteiniphilum marinum TaxID=2774191 RepID=UPI00193AF754|nr:hypothetical protein [Cysteiniphilum marinum]
MLKISNIKLDLTMLNDYLTRTYRSWYGLKQKPLNFHNKTVRQYLIEQLGCHSQQSKQFLDLTFSLPTHSGYYVSVPRTPSRILF